jgi:hypothetical protein
METVKIVFDIDTKDVKTSTQELQALNKVTNEEVASLNKLSTAAEDAGDGFVSLRTQVKQAKEEAQKAAEKYGEFSKEANAARVKAGALADQMGDLNRQVNLLNPEAKAKAFSNLAQGVVGAFSVATGALQAFGVKNKEVEEIAMQLQGALNITQGIASLGQLKEAYQDIKVVLGVTVVAQEALTVANTAEAASATVAATATTGFATALAATGIGAIVIAIGALVGAMLVLGTNTEDAEQKQKDFEEALKNTNEQLDYQQQLANSTAASIGKQAQLDALRAKAKGQSEKEIAAITESAYQRQKTLLELDRDNQRKAYLDASKNEKLKYEDYEKFLKRYKDSERALGELNANFETQVLNDQINQQDKAQQQREKNAAKRKEDLQKQIQEAEKLMKLQDELRQQLQSNALAEVSDPAKRLEMERQFANQEYALQQQRLENEGATQEERDLLAAKHTETVAALSKREVDINKEKNDKVLAAEDKLQKSLLALALAQETDPLKRAQIINDAKEKEIDDKLALVEKGSKDELALLADKETAEIEAAKRIGAAQIEVNKTTNDAITEEDKKAAEDRKALQEAALQSAQFIGDTLFESSVNQTNAELALLEEQKGQKLISEKDYQEKVRKLRQKQAEDQKKQAIFNATVDLARAIIAALTIAPPASAVAANFAAILGGANLAKIIATPIPRFQKGTLAVPGVDMGRDSVHAILQPGEAVIPTKTNRAYHPTIKAIYEKKISPSEINNFVMSRISSGGRQSVTANIDTYALGRALGKNKTVEVGNANMIGRAMAKELLRGQNIRRS